MKRFAGWHTLFLLAGVLVMAACAPVAPVAVAGNGVEAGIEDEGAFGSADDEAAIRDLLAELEEGWKTAEGSAVAATFTEESDFVAGDGRYVKGRTAIAPFFDFVFEQIFPGGYPVTEIMSVRFLADNVAVMHTKGGILLPGETSVPAERIGIQSFVAVKHEGQWLFTAYQNTRIVEFP